jgi:3-dehydroquinate synthase
MEQTIVNSNGYSIFIGNSVIDTVRAYLIQYEFKEIKIFILVDENTRKYCLPRLMSNIQLPQEVHILEIASGEEFKNLDTARKLWSELTFHGANRNSILINLGGGVISDLGGFVAGGFMRGIRYLNIPTTLLAMVDASIGGKVGIDFDGLKNQIGLFINPQVVFIIPEFLDTLPESHKRNGFAEIIKHSLIYEKNYWDEISLKSFKDIDNWKEIIDWSIEIKNYFVTEDPTEKGFRKVLNFGHTIGHAVESYSFQFEGEALSHGEAVAIGIICESYISHKQAGLSENELNEIVSYVSANFEHYQFRRGYFIQLLELMLHDKKNISTNINFTLLSAIGNSIINEVVDVALVKESLLYYQNLFT